MKQAILIKSRISKKQVLNFAFFLFFLVATNCDWRASGIFWWGSVLVVIAAYVAENNGKFRFQLNGFSVWWIIFILVCTFSAAIAIKPGIVLSVLKTLIVLAVITFLMCSGIHSEADIKKYLSSMTLAISVNLLYVLLTKDLEQFQLAQHGWGNTGRWNGNELGMMAAIIVPFLLYFIFDEKKWRLLNILVIPVACYIVYVTASRKAFMILILGVCGYIMLRKPKKLIRNLCIVTIFAALVLYAVIEVPVLYEAIGWRIEGMLALATGEGGVDSSAALRMRYINLGIEAFKSSPILGYGIDNYRILNGIATGHTTYSHNNFIEILVGIGFVGFIAYYWIYLVIVPKYIRILFSGCSSMLLNVLAIVFGLYLLMHVGVVAYYDFIQVFLVLVMYYMVTKFEKGVTR